MIPILYTGASARRERELTKDIQKNSLGREAVFQCMLFKFKGVALKRLIRNFNGISRAAFKSIHHIVY
jgi:hypothetical protein